MTVNWTEVGVFGTLALGILNHFHVKRVHDTFNSRMDEFLKLTAKTSRAEGKAEGIAEGKAEHDGG